MNRSFSRILGFGRRVSLFNPCASFGRKIHTASPQLCTSPFFNPYRSFGTNRTSIVSPELASSSVKVEQTQRTRKGAAKNSLDYAAKIKIFDETDKTSIKRDTSIVCTIGPNTDCVEMLSELVGAGMGIARINMSHGDHASAAEVIQNLRQVRENFMSTRHLPIGLAIDLKGPEVRTGMVGVGNTIKIAKNDIITLTTDKKFQKNCSIKNIYVDYEKLPKNVSVGDVIYVDDGLICLKVKSISVDLKSIDTVAMNGGNISHKKGINVPGVSLELPSVTEQDAKDIKFAVQQKATMIFASFIRTAKDVLAIRKVMGEEGKRIKIISKIESQEGVNNYDDILEVSDGIMVARGDLGIEIPPEKVFLAQKMMISKANIVGKPVICATQMLESMTYNPRPTRAEVSDVANAVMDGCDCVMLSGETSKGVYPVESVKMMHEICLSAQKVCNLQTQYRQVLALQPTDISEEENIAVSAASASTENQEISAILISSLSGKSARMLSKYRPRVPIIMATTSKEAAEAALLFRGVYPYLYNKTFNKDFDDYSDYIDEVIAETLVQVHKEGIIKNGSKVIVVQGWSAGSGHTNTLRIIHFMKQ